MLWMALLVPWLLVEDGLKPRNISINLTYFFMTMIPVYINSRVLMPNYLNKGKVVPYLASFSGLVFFFSALLYLLLYVFSKMWAIPYHDFSSPTILGPTLGAVFFYVLFFMILELGRNYIRAQNKNRELEKTNVETELKFLRSQFNPHLLFNALNNIYFLINRDQKKASEALAGFADMLRYQLYECNSEKIDLTQEISYLTNFINVSSLSHQDVNLDIHIDDIPEGQYLSPMLLIPFIENAFKHVSHKNPEEKNIQLKLLLDDDNLIYKVTNSYNPDEPKSKKSGGIGLENINRRLSLLYPDAFVLKTGVYSDHFEALLKLQLS